MRQEGNIIYADEGKVLRYKIDGTLFGTQVILGYRIVNGEHIPDTIDDFEEIDEPRMDDEFINM